MIGISRFLASRGWDITVVTVKQAYSESSDNRSVVDIPDGIRIIRTGSLEVDRFNPRLLMRKPASSGAAGPELGARWWRDLLPGILRYPYSLLHPLGSYPDRQAGWNPCLFPALKRLLAANRYDAVMSSSPPHSTHLALFALKKIRSFRWITDFRDPWSAPPHHGKTGAMMPLTRRLEGAVLGACDHVVANTAGNRKKLLEAFPALGTAKVSVVTNGFDPAEPTGSVSRDEVECDLLYTGEMYEGMLDRCIEAMARLRDDGDYRLPRIFLYGYIDNRSRRMIDRYGLGSAIQFKGHVDRPKSLALMKAAPALLLLVASNKRGASWVPSKLYAYLFANRPVLALVPAGDAADLVERTRAGVALTSRDPAETAAGLRSFVDAVRDGSLRCDRDREEIAHYTMDSIGEQIEEILVRREEDSQ